MRPIDADSMIHDLYCDVPIGAFGSSKRIGMMINYIEKRKTLDAVPVVRCKDCKHSQMTYSGECKYCQLDIDRGLTEATYRDGDWFCADGERKDTDDPSHPFADDVMMGE